MHTSSNNKHKHNNDSNNDNNNNNNDNDNDDNDSNVNINNRSLGRARGPVCRWGRFLISLARLTSLPSSDRSCADGSAMNE